MNFCGWTARNCGEWGRGIERGGQVCLLTVGCDCCTQSATHCYTRFSLPPSCFPSFPSSSSSPPTYFKALRPQHFWQLRRALLGSNYMLAFSRVGKRGLGRGGRSGQMETRPKTLVVEHALRFFICISLARLEELSSLFSRREF